MDRSRNTAFDILRIIAAFSVVMLHASSRYIMMSDVNDATFTAANFYDSINRFGVPVFVMISGALFINPNRENDVKRLWMHNILRLLVVYFLWCYVYYIFQSIYLWKFDFWHQNIMRTVKGIAYATDHLWFLGMLVGLYALSPVINSWIRNASKQNIEYFLFLVVVFQVIRTTITILLNSSLVSRFSEIFTVAELSGYLGYFVFGYYLSNFEVPKKLRYAIYGSIPLAVAINYLVSWKMSINQNGYNPGIYDSFGLFTFLEAIALFMLVVNLCRKRNVKPSASKVLKAFSKDTFGVYLMHVMILDYIYYEGYLSLALPSVLWEIPVAILIFIVSMCISALLRRIPYVGRYLC